LPKAKAAAVSPVIGKIVQSFFQAYPCVMGKYLPEKLEHPEKFLP